MTRENNRRPVDILLVEDNPGDARLAKEAFKDGKAPTEIHVVSDGVEAMNFLRRQGQYADAPFPDLILLDLNLPRKDGREVLAEIKTDSNLKRIPVIILTVSNAEQDIIQTYNLHAACYLNKPFEFDEFMELVQQIDEFWLATAKLPPKIYNEH
ncbi:MAG: response regulator [Dehalococcoidia bacterium]